MARVARSPAPHYSKTTSDQAHSRLTSAIWTPPVVQGQWTQSPARVGLHVDIRLVSMRCYSSPDGNTHIQLPYDQRSRAEPAKLSGWRYVGL